MATRREQRVAADRAARQKYEDGKSAVETVQSDLDRTVQYLELNNIHTESDVDALLAQQADLAPAVKAGIKTLWMSILGLAGGDSGGGDSLIITDAVN